MPRFSVPVVEELCLMLLLWNEQTFDTVTKPNRRLLEQMFHERTFEVKYLAEFLPNSP